MSSPQASRQVLDRQFLEMRARILDLAASFDRLERADEFATLAQDPRLQRLRDGVRILLQENCCDRAEKLQMLFSDEYVTGWQAEFAMPAVGG